jgi:hypothetical protein
VVRESVVNERIVCLICGTGGTFDNPLRWDTFGFDFVSDPFPAHPVCMGVFLEHSASVWELA